MENILSFSGGIESTCCLFMGFKKILKIDYAIFCDTGWERQQTYDHIKYCEKRKWFSNPT